MQHALITQSLAQQGFEIISGKDGEERLELAIENVPDLVITDSEMPPTDQLSHPTPKPEQRVQQSLRWQSAILGEFVDMPRLTREQAVDTRVLRR